MLRRVVFLSGLIMLAALAACATPIAMPTNPPATGAEPTTAATEPAAPATTATEPTAAPSGAATELVVVSHDSFNMSEEVLQEFETANNAKVQILESGDAGSALNKAILAGSGNPLGDLFFGVDNTFLSRALAADLFEPYEPTGAADIADAYKLDPEWRMTPIDYGDVCLNYDKAWFTEKNIPPPPRRWMTW